MADFVNGLIVKKPHENAPDFIIGKLSFKVDEFIDTLKEHNNNGWFNVEIKESKKGSYYAEIDNWKPNQEPQTKDESQDDSDLPF